MFFNAGKIIEEERENIFAAKRKDENLFDKKSEWDNNLFKEDYERNKAIRNGSHKRKTKKQESERKAKPEFQEQNLFDDVYQKRESLLHAWLADRFRTNVQQATKKELDKSGEVYAALYQESRKGMEQYKRERQPPETFSTRINEIFKKRRDMIR